MTTRSYINSRVDGRPHQGKHQGAGIVLKAQPDGHQASHDSLPSDSLVSVNTGLLDDVPILPNIQAETPSPNLIKYKVPASAGDAVRFYQAEMPRYDWAVQQKHLIRPDLAVLSYAKDGKRATIIIHQDGEALTRIMITIAGQISGEKDKQTCQRHA
jgi:hypothetical protein